MMYASRKNWLPLLVLAVLLGGGMAAQAQQAGASTDRLQALQKLQTANTLFSQRDYEGARRLYTEILPFFTDNVDFLEKLAECNYRLRNYEEAVRHYRRAYELNPSSLVTLDRLADSLSRLRRYEEAADVFRRLAQQPDAPARTWKYAAEAYANGGRDRDAELAYDAYLQRNPGDLDARTDLGEIYTRKRDYDRALEQFNLVLATNPNFTDAVVGTARAYSRQSRHKEALEMYDRALRLSPSNGEALTGKAFTLFWLERYAEARDLFAQLQKRFPESSEIAGGLRDAQAKLEGRALAEARQAGNVAEVETLYRQRLARNQNDVEALKFLANATATAGQCRESIQLGNRALVLDPNDAQMELTLARAFALCERYDESYAHYRRYVEVQERAEQPLTELGALMLRARRPMEAADIFQTVLQVNPDNTEANLGLARARAAEGKYAEALARYEAVLEKKPDHYDALQGKAHVLYYTKDYAAAKPLFEELARRSPEDASNREALDGIARADEAARWEALRPRSDAAPEEFVAYYQRRLEAFPNEGSSMRALAYNYGRLRDYSNAVEWYRKVLAVDPTDRGARLDLARIYSFDRQYDASIQLYQELLRETPDDTTVLENLARVYLWANRYELALAVYQDLATRQPGNVDYRLDVVRMQMRLEDYAAARSGIDSVLQLDPENREALLYRAQLELQAGQRQESLQHYEAVLAQNPRDPDALYGKARIQYYEGDLSGAHQTVTTLLEEKPDSFDALFLAANIQDRRRKRGAALALLERADQVSPDNADVQALSQRIRERPYVTLQTRTSYSREYADTYDLRSQRYGLTLGWEMFPNTDSFLTWNYSPTSLRTPLGTTRLSPPPTEVLYWQNTRVNPKLTIRGGIGSVVASDGTAEHDVIGLLGFTYAPNRKFSFEMDYSRSTVNYTPTSILLGVIRNQWGAGLNFFFDEKTRLLADYDFARFKADRLASDLGPTHEQAHLVNVLFQRDLVDSDRVYLALGYNANFQNYGGLDFLGYFDPDFYQVHDAVADFKVTLWNPVDLRLEGGFGMRQRHDLDSLGQETRDWRPGGGLSPSLIVRVHRRLTVTLRYSYYNTSQALDPLSLPGTRDQLVGNVFSITTDWKF